MNVYKYTHNCTTTINKMMWINTITTCVLVLYARSYVVEVVAVVVYDSCNRSSGNL